MRLLTLILIALAIPFAAACGSDDGGSGTTAAAPSGGGQTVDLSATDFHFTPPTVSVDAGTVTFKLTNNGETSHALEIEGNGVQEETDTIGPGESAELTVDLEAGEYEIYCPVGNHKDMGMVGTVTVG